MLSIAEAGLDDIPTIGKLAHAIWPVSYQGIITNEQIDYMLNLIYSEAALTDQINKLRHRFIILYDDEQPVGFASYSRKISDIHIFRLNKIYLLPAQQGKGYGNFLLQYVINAAKAAGGISLELNVNKHNPALGFYKKYNFYILKAEVLDIGNGYVMDDYVMARELGG